MKHLAALLLTFLSLTALAHPQATQSDLDTIRARYIQSLLPPSPAGQQALHAEAIRLATALTPEGTWPDLDYTLSARSAWPSATHPQRILVLAKSARFLRDTGRPDPALEAKAIASLRWWLDHDPHNPNWWWNEIGIPQLLVEIATLLAPQLTPDDLARIHPILLRSVWTRWTGANLVWGTTIQIARGVLDRDPAAVSVAYARLYQEIRRTPSILPDGKPGESIQADNSFHQHGTQFYSGGYGLDFTNDVGRYVAFSWDTSVQIPADRMNLFSSFILDGEQWMIRGDTFDYSATGREITRPGKAAVNHDWTRGSTSPVGAAYALTNVIASLASVTTPRQPEFRTFAARLNGIPNTPELSGNKHFWTSDYTVHRRPGFFTSVRMLSTRTLNSETVNSEGLRSQHLTDGVNLLYRTGNEYRDIFPVWNWNLLPGTTAQQATLPNGVPDTGEKKSVNNRGLTTFVGGVSDGQYGATAMDLQRGPVTAKKAWFFFDTFYIALGAGINGGPAPVATDINQSLLNGSVLANNKPLSATPSTLKYVHHDQTGYILGPNTKATVTTAPQTGRWSDLGTGPSDPVTLPVFNLWIDHGPNAQNATYEYAILPNATPQRTAQASAHPPYQVLANTPDLQAVYVPILKRAALVFRKPAKIQTPIGLIETDHPCLLLATKTTLTASNPNNEPLTLTVTLSGHSTTFHLPAGDQAGSSQTLPTNP